MPRRSVPSTCWAMAYPMRSQYVESELTTLGRTVAASAPMLQTITRLGAGLNAFNANAAPIAMPSGTRYLPDVPIEQLSPAMPEQTLAPAASRSDGYDRSKPTATLDRATPLPSQGQPRTEGSLPPPQQVSRREAVTTPHEGPPLTRPTAAQPTGSAMAPATSSPASPLPSRPRSAAAPVEPPSSSLTRSVDHHHRVIRRRSLHCRLPQVSPRWCNRDGRKSARRRLPRRPSWQ